MAAGTRTTDTFTEGLRKLLSSITDLKMSDDADMPFIINLETQVLGRLKQQGSDALSGGGPMMPGAGPVGLPGAPPPGMGSPPAAVPGVMQGPNMPNPDELRRVLAGP